MKSYTDEERAKIINAFGALPLHQQLGLRFGSGPKGPLVSFEVTPLLTGGYDYLHGGALYAALDVAAAFSLVHEVPPGVQEKTIDITISMIRSAKTGDVIEMTTDIDHMGRKNAFITARAHRASDGKLIARATVTKVFVALDRLAAADALARGERIPT